MSKEEIEKTGEGTEKSGQKKESGQQSGAGKKSGKKKKAGQKKTGRQRKPGQKKQERIESVVPAEESRVVEGHLTAKKSQRFDFEDSLSASGDAEAVSGTGEETAAVEMFGAAGADAESQGESGGGRETDADAAQQDEIAGDDSETDAAAPQRDDVAEDDSETDTDTALQDEAGGCEPDACSSQRDEVTGDDSETDAAAPQQDDVAEDDGETDTAEPQGEADNGEVDTDAAQDEAGGGETDADALQRNEIAGDGGELSKEQEGVLDGSGESAAGADGASANAGEALNGEDAESGQSGAKKRHGIKAVLSRFVPLVPQKKRSKKKGKKKKEKEKKKLGMAGFIVRCFFCVLAVALLGGIGYGLNYVISFMNAMPEHDMAEIEASLKTMSTIYDDQGIVIKDLYIADSRREIVTYEEIPKNLINAVVAIEDKTFWYHKGFNITRILGALYESRVSGGEISGTSTISQQLARNIWLSDVRSERTLDRKMREAVFARELEEALTKEEIITHYLNMVSLGNHSYGVKAAAKLYFNKELNQLDILECAALAALPQSPSHHSMITTVPVGEADPDDPDVLLVTDEYIFLYNEDSLPRIHFVLGLMLEQGYISAEQYEHAVNDNLRRHLHPQPLQTSGQESFFIDWVVNDVAEDILAQYPDEFASIDEALQLVYSGGLEIYSTFSPQIQQIATEEFENAKNYPLAYMNRDSKGNVLGDDNEVIVLFDYNNMFVNREASEETQEQALAGEDPDAQPTKQDLAGIGEPWFYLNDEDFEMLSDGSMRIFAGEDKRLGIYYTSGDWGEDISVEFKDFYTRPPNSFYIVKGGKIAIPSEYKRMDSSGNLIISGDFFKSEDNIFEFVPFEVAEGADPETVTHENGAKGEYWIGPSHFVLEQPVVQPQGATTIIEHQTGQVKAMVGGRGIEGNMQYNRSLAERQPGSTMKPIGVYAPALQKSAEGLPVSYPEDSLGEYWTAASVIPDEVMEYEGRVWPNNWYGGYRGPQTMRKAIEQSINVCAVRAQIAVGNKRSVEFLKKLGITSIVEDGVVNDLNPSALGLGGMTNGISPLESAAAYGTFANGGEHIDPIGYTVVKFRNGETLLDGTPKSEQVMDEGAAFIMQDMLRTAVSNGIASTARVQGVPVAGKTGTSSEQVDAWFAGFTPKYVASVWIGIDVKMRMSQNSAAAARMFSKIMTRVYNETAMDPGEFRDPPENVERGSVSGVTDYFIIGTKPDRLLFGDLVCLDSNYLATPSCVNTERRAIRGLNGMSGSLTPEEAAAGSPYWYCPIHNPNPARYPTDPAIPPPG